MTTKTKAATVIAGTRPVGSCKPDGSHIWATVAPEDGQYRFTKYNGWLISEETITTSVTMAAILTDVYQRTIVG
jgi:hypothetical protein